MRRIVYLGLSLIVILAMPSAWAVKVSSIYQADIPVTSQNADEKARAAQAGLEQVLVKVSGNKEVLKNYPLKPHVKEAEQLAQQYRYSNSSVGTKTANLLTIQYDAEGVNRLLREAGAPIWGPNRPLMMVMLVVENPNHPADIVDSATNEFQTALKTAARLRGLPIILPVMDMTDMNQINIEDILKPAIPKLQIAAERYASNVILLGHITQDDAKIKSQWTLVMDNDQVNWTVNAKTLPDILNTIMDDVSDTLVSHYATVQTEAVQSEVAMKVTGVDHQSDLVSLMRYLQRLSTVAEVQLTSVTGNEVSLNVNLRGTKQSFLQALALQKNLISSTNTDSMDETLIYRWMP